MLTKMVQKCTKLKKQTIKGREYHDGIFNIFNFHTDYFRNGLTLNCDIYQPIRSDTCAYRGRYVTNLRK